MRKAFFILALLISFIAQSQILDDTTKNLYGFKTTRYFTYKQVFEDSLIYNHIDTSINNLHRYDYSYNNQLLGNTSTASKSLIYSYEKDVFFNEGENVFSIYQTTFENRKFYNTKSPFSKLNYIQGNEGDRLLSGLFTQNITPVWNIGFDWQRITSDKLYGSSSLNDKFGRNQQFNIFSSLLSEDKKFSMLINYQFFKHDQEEIGGVQINSDYKNKDKLDSLMGDFRKLDGNLTGATSIYKQKQFDIFTSFAFSDKVNVYHRFQQFEKFRKFSESSINGFFSSVLRDSSKTIDEWTHVSNRHYFGINYNSKKLFIKSGIVLNEYQYYFNHYNKNERKNEFVLENNIKYFFNKELIFKFLSNTNKNGNYLYNVNIQNKNWKIEYERSKRKPSMIYTLYVGNHYRWEPWKNVFDYTRVENFNIQYVAKTKSVEFLAKASYIMHSNYVYFNQNSNPKQHKPTIQTIPVEIFIHTWFSKIHFTQHFNINLGGNQDIIRLPTFISQTQVYYYNTLFKNNLTAKIGIENRISSSYFADSYNPAIQNFYIQDDFEIYSYPLIDVFFDFKINNVLFFFKFGHASQFFGRETYFTTPYYPHKKFNFVFGLKWNFFT